MNYSLAKELKDAGFPQVDDEQRTVDNVLDVIRRGGNVNKEGETAYVPTLEELIEACGKGKLAWDYTDGRDFTAMRDDIKTHGPTPTEAVARLWLALKNKI